MRSFFATLRQLVLPAGALPGSPRIVMGPDIPPELAAWATANGCTFYSLRIYYYNADTYTFDGIGSFSGITSYFIGTYDPGNTVYIWQRLLFLGGTGAASLEWRIGSNALNTFQANVKLQKVNVTIGQESNLNLLLNGQGLINGDFTIDTRSQPRGLVARVDATGSTPDIGVEAVAMTTPTMSFVAGRAYRVQWQGPLITSLTNQTTLRVRKNNLAGALLAEWNVAIANSGTNWQSTGYAYVRNNTGVDVTNTALALTMAATAGISRFQATTTSVATVEVTDAGAAADYPNAISI